MTDREHLRDALGATVDHITDMLYDAGAFKARDLREPGRIQKQRSELRLQSAVMRHFRRQRAALAEYWRIHPPMHNVKAWDDLDPVLDDAEFLPQIIRILFDFISSGVGIAAETLGAYPIDFTTARLHASEWAQKFAGEMITRINDTTLKAVRDAVSQFHANEAMTLGDLEKLLPLPGLSKDEGAGVNMSAAARAQLVAVTETTRAYGQGVNLFGAELQDEYGDSLEITRVWRANEDTWFENNTRRGVCEYCEALDGQEVGLDEPFKGIDGDTDDVPEHVGCRCWTTVSAKVKK